MRRAQIADFSFTRSFVFFRRKRRVKSRSLRWALKQLAVQADLENMAPPVVRHKLTLTAPGAYVNASMVLGEIVLQPAFANGTLSERVIAYALLLENEHFAAIQLRHISVNDIEPLLEAFDFVSHSQITSVFSNSARILRVAARIINPAQRGLTGRAYEGKSLQNEMPQYGNGKTIPRSLKASDSGETISVTAGASRITSYGQAVGIDRVGDWFHRMSSLLSTNQRSTFVSRFAAPIDFASGIRDLTPKLIVFDTLALQNHIKDDNLVLRRKFKPKGSKKTMRSKATLEMYSNVISALENMATLKEAAFPLGEINTNTSSLKINLSVLKNFTLYDGRKDVSLSAYINKKDLFSVYFDSPQHVYMSGSLFMDAGLLAEIDSVIASLEGILALTTADREKTDVSRDRPHPNKANLTSFPNSSVFAIAEGVFAHADYIFCDDLGDEWADHIVINNAGKTLSFVHSKHGAQSTGASKLHDVVGIEEHGQSSMHAERTDPEGAWIQSSVHGYHDL